MRARCRTPASSASGMYQGRETLGIRLNFSKRYITLAPIATIIGLAFRLFDPDKLLGGDKTDYGITVALVPRDTPGITIGRRHFPLNGPFQNGPIQGKDVFVPLDAIIGGPKMAGQGWRMLVEQLSVGRCISLPSIATGGAQGRRVFDRRLRAHPPPVQPAGRQVRGRRGRDRAHGRAHLHHGRRALGDDRRDRRRREAVRARRHPEVPHRPSSAARSRTTRWTCRAARASCSARRTTSAAATRWCRSASRSRARTS